MEKILPEQYETWTEQDKRSNEQNSAWTEQDWQNFWVSLNVEILTRTIQNLNRMRQNVCWMKQDYNKTIFLKFWVSLMPDCVNEPRIRDFTWNRERARLQGFRRRLWRPRPKPRLEKAEQKGRSQSRLSEGSRPTRKVAFHYTRLERLDRGNALAY